MTDIATSSASTWLDEPAAATGSGFNRPLDERLEARQQGFAARVDGLRERYRIRQQLANETYGNSRHPQRGLPVAPASSVVRFLKSLLWQRPVAISVWMLLTVGTAVAGLVVPLLLGSLIDAVTGERAGDVMAEVTRLALLVVVAVVLSAVLRLCAGVMSHVVGQAILAEAREYVVRMVLRLPLSKVEAASTGDLVTRVTRDVGQMSGAVRWGLPQFVIASVTVVLTLAAVVINSWLLALPILVSVGLLCIVVPRYLRRAPAGYITEGASYSQINSTVTESVEGARTAEALQMGDLRVGLTDRDVAWSGEAERYTLSIRNLLYSTLDFAFNGPLIGIVLLGYVGHVNGMVTLGQITAAALYSQRLVEPMDVLIHTLDRLQVGLASTTRLLGIAEVPQDREPSGDEPNGNTLIGRDLRFAYREGHDVLQGIDLELEPGERLAIVGPSGSGKSTLSRLLSGINRPRTGVVTVGEMDVMDLPLERLRTEVALVTQEHHVFVGSVRDNVVLARETTATDDEVRDALRAVEAAEWVDALPDGMATQVGSGNMSLTPAQAQQIALARLVVADPHTLVLDEATSLIDPRTARHLEGSMAALMSERTVVAIAHRLHTAHDADRIAVVIDGRIAELGSHDDLMQMDGEYAHLWNTWRS